MQSSFVILLGQRGQQQQHRYYCLSRVPNLLAGEEMGLGKTVEIAALILSRPAPALQTVHQTTADGLLISRYFHTSCWSLSVLSLLHGFCS